VSIAWKGGKTLSSKVIFPKANLTKAIPLLVPWHQIQVFEEVVMSEMSFRCNHLINLTLQRPLSALSIKSLQKGTLEKTALIRIYSGHLNRGKGGEIE